MSFNKTTTNQLSDAQMAELTEEINSAAAANKPAPVDLSGVMGGIGTLQTGQGGINTNISGVGESVTGGFNSLTGLLNSMNTTAGAERNQIAQNQMTGFGQLSDQATTGFGELGQQLTGVGDDVTQGFADQTTRFDTLDQSVGGVQETVDQNNADISTMSGTMDDRFNTTDTNFAEAGKALQQGFDDTQADVATLQTEALKGQGNILSDLETAKSERDAYNVANTDAQTNMLENQATFKSNFDDYVQRYTDNTTLQNENLGNIQTGLTGFAGDINNSLAGLGSAVGANADAVAAAAAAADANSVQAGSVESILQGGFNDLGGQLDGSLNNLQGTVQGGFSDLGGNLNSLDGSLQGSLNSLGSGLSSVDQNVSGLAGDISGLAKGQGNIQSAISSGFNTSQGSLNKLGNSLGQDFGQLQSNVTNSVDSMGNEQVDYTNQFEQVTGQLKSLSQLSGLPDQMRQQFHQLGGSFDKQGNLIQNSIDEQGNTITRAMDNQGNMLLRKFDSSGASMGQMVMNLNDVMGQINQLGLVPGGSAGMGILSQPLQDLGTGNGGFMSPFGRTQ